MEAEDTYVDVPLSNLMARGALQGDFLADAIAPPLVLGKQTGTYWRMDPYNAEAVLQDSTRAPGGEPKPIWHGKSIKESVYVDDHSFEDKLPDEVRDQAEDPQNA